MVDTNLCELRGGKGRNTVISEWVGRVEMDLLFK